MCKVFFEEVLHPLSKLSCSLHQAFPHYALVLCASFRGSQHPVRLHNHPELSCRTDRKQGEQWLLCETLGGGGARKDRKSDGERGAELREAGTDAEGRKEVK